ncbi:hypothetical protein HHE06_00470 [Helicobacter heilmannii]|nr:hypothetical protein [Helicobacter heilmannii]CRF46238.1 hypothetical protein HHE014_12340 [Helicobacter heilmannii]CRF49460.1 hypothetical protein HHE03_10760 [Helicobacter heilmannii]CRF50227.1 hypothetical protein HHE06_00470 [Helicobacter heilmannii]
MPKSIVEGGVVVRPGGVARPLSLGFVGKATWVSTIKIEYGFTPSFS